MTPDEIRIAQALHAVRFPVGSDDKRFARMMSAHAHNRAHEPITPEAGRRLRTLAWRYRDQLADAVAVLGS
ncbi:MAG TPA: hypothetical protein VD866_01500 [Urbifossiella sp.]|nr:hypothetical protein [Urbifossiella sp.]